jgi:hypothetical protein
VHAKSLAHFLLSKCVGHVPISSLHPHPWILGSDSGSYDQIYLDVLFSLSLICFGEKKIFGQNDVDRNKKKKRKKEKEIKNQ